MTIRLVHNSIRDIKTWDQELNSIVLFVYNLKILPAELYPFVRDVHLSN